MTRRCTEEWDWGCFITPRVSCGVGEYGEKWFVKGYEERRGTQVGDLV